MKSGDSLPLESKRLLSPVDNDSHAVIGNPENRRVLDYQSAAHESGHPVPTCIAWRDLLENPALSIQQLNKFKSVRIDSFGEDPHVLAGILQLARHGNCARPIAVPAFGEILSLDHQFAGFRKLLNKIENEVQNVVFQNSPAAIKLMFDKWESHQLLNASGICRVETQLVPLQFDHFTAFRVQMARQCGMPANSGRLFLKPRYASSASGVCAYRWSGDREQIIAPIELVQTDNNLQLFNSLKIRTYTRASDIIAILGHLIPQGMIAERWVRKARLDDGQFDLRIVVINGTARHTVVRQSHWPMTNLHLGNRRASLDQALKQIGEERFEQCRQLAELATQRFGHVLYAGVDIIVPNRGQPLVCEVNAFGDLLPGIQHNGETVYQAILNSHYQRLNDTGSNADSALIGGNTLASGVAN